MIVQCPGFIAPAECAEFCQMYDRLAPASRHRGYTGEPIVYLHDHPAVARAVADFVGCAKPDAVVLACLNAGGYHPKHTDNGRPDIAHRRTTAMLYLNDDFDGGELHSPVEQVTIAPQPGLLVTFPAELEHEVWPVGRGRRYSIAMWFGDAANIG